MACVEVVVGRRGVIQLSRASTTWDVEFFVPPGNVLKIWEIIFCQTSGSITWNDASEAYVTAVLTTGFTTNGTAPNAYFVPIKHESRDLPFNTGGRLDTGTLATGGSQTVRGTWNWNRRLPYHVRFKDPIVIAPDTLCQLNLTGLSSSVTHRVIMVIEEFGWAPTQFNRERAGGSTGSQYTLSNGNLTATKTANSLVTALCTNPKNTGKWYFEVTMNQTSLQAGGTDDSAIGLAQPHYILSTFLGAGTSNGWSVGMFSDDVFYNNTDQNIGTPAWVSGDTLRCAVDLNVGVGKVWFGHQGGWYGDPEAGTGQAHTISTATYDWLPFGIVPGVVVDDNTASCTANFGASAFVHTVPSGFTAWDG